MNLEIRMNSTATCYICQFVILQQMWSYYCGRKGKLIHCCIIEIKTEMSLMEIKRMNSSLNFFGI